MTSLLRGSSALVCAFAIAAGMAATGQAQTPVKFTLDWRFEGPAAPFTVALDKGYFKAEGLDVTIDTGNGSRESIPRVASGTYDIGAGDVNSLVRFRDENPTIDLKAVMMVYDRPPFAIVGRKSKGISRRSQEPGGQEVRRAGRRRRLRPVADLQVGQQARRQRHEIRERRLSRARADAGLRRGRCRVRLLVLGLHEPEVARRAGRRHRADADERPRRGALRQRADGRARSSPPRSPRPSRASSRR